MTAEQARPSTVTLIALAFYAGPGAAIFAATSGWGAGSSRRWVRAMGLVVTALVVTTLLIRPLRWQIVVAVWAAVCLAAAVVAVVLARRGRHPVAPAVQPGWGRQLVVTAMPLAAAVASLLLAARLLGWTLLGGLLARFDPGSIDFVAGLGALAIDGFWAVPAVWIFAALAFRRGRLGTPGGVLRALLAWTAFLILLELVMLATFGIMRTQLIAVAGFDDGEGQMWLVKLLLGASAVAATGRLAWRAGSWWRRLAATTALLLMAVLSLALLTGGSGRVQLALGRMFDRQDEADKALHWYGRALVAGGGAPLRSYLQHRIGLLQYRRGNLEQAMAAFRLVATTHNATESLVRESTYFLERLEAGASVGGESSVAIGDGREARVVVDGITVATERRADYCAPNTMALVLDHWGRSSDVGAIGEEVALIGAGTSTSEMRFLFERLGLALYLYPLASFDDVRWLIDRDLPALLFTAGHVLAVYGYDDRLGTAVTYDTATWGVWVDQPYPDLLQSWSEELFLLGVVLPRTDETPAVAAARNRFGGARALAAWQWALYEEAPAGTEEEEGRLRRGVRADPTLMHNVFTMLQRSGSTPWLEEHSDLETASAEAYALIERPYGLTAFTIRGLARRHFAAGQLEEVVELADGLRRRDLWEDVVSTLAGRAAAALGRWEDAAFYLTQQVSEELEHEAPALSALVDAYRELEDQDLLEPALRALAGQANDEVLASVVTLAESLEAGHGTGFLVNVYENYVAERPYDVERQLRLADLLRRSDRRAEDRPQRLQRARRAVALATAFTNDPELRAEAQALAGEIDRERAALRLDDL